MSPLLATLPLQLTLAVRGDMGAGYDSTAINPRTGRYEDAFVLRTALDAQAAYQGDTVQQYLRNRAELMYDATGGRDLLDSDVFNVTHYALAWQPNELVSLHTDATYAIGAPTLFFSRAGRPDVSFARRGLAYPRQMIADYAVRQDLVYHWNEVDAVQIEAVVQGRYPVTRQPRGENMFTPYGGLRFTHEIDEDNNLHFGARAEYLALELFRPVWVFETFTGWGHRFDENTDILIEAGVDVVERNLGEDNWDLQPYFRARAYRRFDMLDLILGISYAHTFGVVSPTLGTGSLDIATAAGYWRPRNGPVVLYADASAQRGDGYDLQRNLPMTETFATVGTGMRVRVHPNLWLWARYDFQWETNDAYAFTGDPDFVRHVALVGLEFAWASDELAMVAMLPAEELSAMQGILGVGPTPEAGPVREAAPSMFEPERERHTRLPGDPPDDELEREQRERERDHGDDQDALPPLPGDDVNLPGSGDLPETHDPIPTRDN